MIASNGVSTGEPGATNSDASMGSRVAAAIVSTACRAGCAADAVRVKAGEPRIRATSQWIDRRGSMHRGTIALEFKQLKPLVRNLAMTIQWNRLAL